MNISSNRLNAIKKVSILFLIVNILITILKFAAGIIFSNLSVISDGIHSVGDVIMTLIVLICAYISSSHNEKKYCYGKEKYEAVFSKILAIVLLLSAALLIKESIEALITPSTEKPEVILIIITSIAIIAKFFLFFYGINVAKKINSSTLKADSWHNITDAVASTAVLIGLVCNLIFGWTFMESVAILIISVLIIVISVEIYIDATAQLVDKALDEKYVEKIKSNVLSVNGVLSVKSIKSRLSVNIAFVDITIGVSDNLSVKETDIIRNNVIDQLKKFDDITIKEPTVIAVSEN